MLDSFFPPVADRGALPRPPTLPKPVSREKGWVHLILSTGMGALAVFLAACSSSPTSKAPEAMDRQVASAAQSPGLGARGSFTQTGKVSWYGQDHRGRLTANGERFNPSKMTGAHKTLPFGSMVRVTRTDTGKSVVIRINDRGPYIRGRIIDVSQEAAEGLDLIVSGVAPCRVDVIGPRRWAAGASVAESATISPAGATHVAPLPSDRVMTQITPKDF